MYYTITESGGVINTPDVFLRLDTRHRIHVTHAELTTHARDTDEHARKRVARYYILVFSQSGDLCPLATDAASELDVLGHDSNTLGVDRAQVGVFEEADLEKETTATADTLLGKISYIRLCAW